MSSPVHCYLVDWPALVERATANRAANGLTWFWDAAELREPWVIRYADLVPGWNDSGHQFMDEALAYDDFREALATDTRRYPPVLRVFRG